MIHSIPKPTNPYHCQNDDYWKSNWVLNPINNKCYLFGRNSVIDGEGLWTFFDEADEYCTKLNAISLVIENEQEQSWLVPRLYGDTWLNMKFITPPQVEMKQEKIMGRIL